ncbi:hypothetical protein OQA88_3124 [Cercophora sp. LCS_1]
MDDDNYFAEAERDRRDDRELAPDVFGGYSTYAGRPVTQWVETERNGITIESDKAELEAAEFAREEQERGRKELLRHVDDDWVQVLDNGFAAAFFKQIELFGRYQSIPKYDESGPTGLCRRCSTFTTTVDLRSRLKPCFKCRVQPRRAQAVEDRLEFLRAASSLRVCLAPTSKDPRVDLQVGFPALLEPDSGLRFKLFKEWLSVCSDHHPVCERDYGRFSSEPPRTGAPTRLIAVGSEYFDEPLRLVTCNQDSNSSPRYIALSHCWGNLPEERKRQYCTTTDNISRRLGQGFPLEELPKTFRDAVAVAKKLGVEYLWIDSLCIIQYGDDLADWKREAKRMETVFRNAYCTIAATSARDSDAGFLRVPSPPPPGGRDDENDGHHRQARPSPKENPPPSYITLRYFPPSSSSSSSSSLSSSPSSSSSSSSAREETVYISRVAPDDFHGDVESGSLNRRAWVLQERALSARTIHFTSSQAYFECGHGVRCETLTRVRNARALLLGDPDFPRSMNLRATARDRVALFQHLFGLYSRLGITVPTDRALAIAGMEERLAGVLKTRVSYGVFERYLHRGLLWQRRRRRRRRSSGGGDGDGDVTRTKTSGKIAYPEDRPVPSWSWMAYEGEIQYLEIDTDLIEWDRDLRLAEDGRALRMRARHFSRSCRVERDDSRDASSRSYLVFADEKDGLGWIRFDRKPRVRNSLREYRCVVVGRERTRYRPGWLARSREGWDCYVLVVTPVELGSAQRAFERVAVGCVPVNCITFRDSKASDSVV